MHIDSLTLCVGGVAVHSMQFFPSTFECS